jgi:hypothetical protein
LALTGGKWQTPYDWLNKDMLLSDWLKKKSVYYTWCRFGACWQHLNIKTTSVDELCEWPFPEDGVLPALCRQGELGVSFGPVTQLSTVIAVEVRNLDQGSEVTEGRISFVWCDVEVYRLSKGLSIGVAIPHPHDVEFVT